VFVAVEEDGMKKLGKIAWVATIVGTVVWMSLLASSPSVPDATHPVRYNHRHTTRYVNEKTNMALQIVLGSSFVMFLVAAGCQFATRDSDKQKGSMDA
jgi:hypothetical protein